MGMFDKDKEVGIILTSWIGANVPFILWGARIAREDYPTNLGPAVQSELTVSKLDDPGDKYEVRTLASAIATKVREAAASDFPAVVQWAVVTSSYGGTATVLSFLKPYGRQDANAPAGLGGTTPNHDVDPAPAATGDEIPY